MLRGNFVVAVHLRVSLTPQFLRAESRLERERFLRNHRLDVFYGTIKNFSCNLEWIRKSLTDPPESL